MFNRNFVASSLLLSALAVAFSIPASASTIPAAVFGVNCSGPDGVIDDPSFCADGGTVATLSVFGGPSGAVDSAYPGDELAGSGAVVNIQYFFEVLGGKPGDVVPVEIFTDLSVHSTSTSPSAYAFAALTVQTALTTKFVSVCTNGTCNEGSDTFADSLTTTALAGDVNNSVFLQVEAGTGDSIAGQFAHAGGDPYIFIDPTFANAAQYSIAVSEGISNTVESAAPEPGGFALAGIALTVWSALRIHGRFHVRG